MSNNLPPQAVLSQMINGYWTTFSIVAAARLGIADQLASGPRTIAELAERTDTNPEALYRLLRALASVGVFAESEPHTFAQTPLSEPLRSGVPGSLRGLAAMSGMLHLRAWPEILHSVRTGKTAFEKSFGKEVFAYLETDAEAAAAFDEAMTGYTAATSKAVAATWDFTACRHIVDVGGGKGALLAEILKANGSARGTNFDLPHVASRGREHIAREGLADRCESVGGDFFEAVPANGDAYLMKMIVHDWDDARAIAILKNVRKAMAANGRVLLIEAVIPPGNAPSPGKLLDVNMLVMTGGRERT